MDSEGEKSREFCVVERETGASERADMESGTSSGADFRPVMPGAHFKSLSDNLFLVEDEIGSVSTAEDSKHVAEDGYACVSVDDDSPFPEVRASVPSTDDPTMPQNTVRMWVLGLLMTTIGCALNALFSLHSPTFAVSILLTAMLAWPLGIAWYYVVPRVSVFGVPLNPGRFNIKEHALIIIMSNVAFTGGTSYATYILLTLKRFYHVGLGWGFEVLLSVTSQCIGLSLSGLSRRVLVSPSSMIWPANLITCIFLTNAHMNVNYSADGWEISRLKFFFYVFAGGFVWYWVPGFLFMGLSMCAWVTWIRPHNVLVNQIFGITSGLGVMPVSFDWNQVVGYIGSPLIPPANVVGTILVSMVTIYWILTPILHYTNTWYGDYLPISNSEVYDRFQQPYNISRVLNADLSFNEAAYDEYSPLYISTTFAVSYGMSFAATVSAVFYTVLFYGPMLYRHLKNPLDRSEADVHGRLMAAYKPVPEWWFAVMFVCLFAVTAVTVEVWDTGFPIFALVVALLMAALFVVPVGVIFAVTSIPLGLNVIGELIGGYIIPGKPVANMLFKTFSYIANYQAVMYTQDAKLAHYMKIKPRVLFVAQFVATLYGSVVQLCVVKWADANIPDLCATDQATNFTCPGTRVFFDASVIWGVIGAKRQYAVGTTYAGVLLFFIAGAVLPVLSWLILKRRPNSIVKHLVWPVFFAATGNIPPATPYNYTLYSIIGLVFGYFVRRRWFHWWSKYNYTLSAALDSGLAWSSFFIFLCLTLNGINPPDWWGNNVINTIDYTSEAIKVKVRDGEWFGAASW